MPGYLLDTNHLSAALSPVSRIRDRIYQEHRRGMRFGVCIPILGELEVGLQSRRKAGSLRRTLRSLLSKIRVWPLHLDDARLYGEIYIDLKQRGKSLSQVDMFLAAVARRMNLTLLTTDRDFEALPDIKTENWLA
jgi:tRNA(fMet)-specific endonuclease VapC